MFPKFLVIFVFVIGLGLIASSATAAPLGVWEFNEPDSTLLDQAVNTGSESATWTLYSGEPMHPSQGDGSISNGSFNIQGNTAHSNANFILDTPLTSGIVEVRLTVLRTGPYLRISPGELHSVDDYYGTDVMGQLSVNWWALSSIRFSLNGLGPTASALLEIEDGPSLLEPWDLILRTNLDTDTVTLSYLAYGAINETIVGSQLTADLPYYGVGFAAGSNAMNSIGRIVVSVIPEPSTVTLLLLGLMGLTAVGRNRQ